MDEESVARLAVMKSCLAALAAQDADGMAEHYTEDYVLELPYFKPNEPLVIAGRENVRSYLAMIVGRQRMEIEIKQVHGIPGEALLIAEYESCGEFTDDGAPYKNCYVGYWYFEGDKIRRLREYYNPQAPRASAID